MHEPQPTSPFSGIPDVLESYRLLRIKLAEAGSDDYDTPQLVICK